MSLSWTLLLYLFFIVHLYHLRSQLGTDITLYIYTSKDEIGGACSICGKWEMHTKF